MRPKLGLRNIDKMRAWIQWHHRPRQSAWCNDARYAWLTTAYSDIAPTGLNNTDVSSKTAPSLSRYVLRCSHSVLRHGNTD